jgi:hypothetical protein
VTKPEPNAATLYDHQQAVLEAHAQLSMAMSEVDELSQRMWAAKARLDAAEGRLRQLARKGAA